MTTTAMRQHDYLTTGDGEDRIFLGSIERVCSGCHETVFFDTFADRYAVHHPSNPQSYCVKAQHQLPDFIVLVIALRLMSEGADQHERYYGPLRTRLTELSRSYVNGSFVIRKTRTI